MNRELLNVTAATLAYWLVFWEVHCWACEQPRDYATELLCPHCGAETCPF